MIKTQLTETLGIRYPIMQAGMGRVAGAHLCAAATNAGGIGCIGGLNYEPRMLRKEIQMVRSLLVDKNAPFGVDLLLPKVGDGARATNYDYTKVCVVCCCCCVFSLNHFAMQGQLEELVQVMVEERIKVCGEEVFFFLFFFSPSQPLPSTKLFVCAVGVPPRWVVDRLHSAGIFVMNMIGLPDHCRAALACGADIICAQGTEAGGHTGDLATSVLVPAAVDACRGHKSTLTGAPVMVVAAGGIYDGRGLAMALALGAEGVWVGTRFVCATESGASENHQQEVISCGFKDTSRTLAFTGRPLRVKRLGAVKDWEENRREEMLALLKKGIIPYAQEEELLRSQGSSEERRKLLQQRHLLMGQCAGAIKSVDTTENIILSMMREAVAAVEASHRRLSKL